MARAKIAISLDERMLKQLDGLIEFWGHDT